MNRLELIGKILFYNAILFGIITAFYYFVINRKRNAFIKEMEEYLSVNPDDPATQHEMDIINEGFKNTVIKPLKVLTILIVITAILAIVGLIFMW